MADRVVTMAAVVKAFGEHRALGGVDLRVDRGETVVVCGASGSGKSTLLRCINGLESHDAGTVEVLGHVVGDDAREIAAVRRRVGMVFQGFNLFPHLTVLENCALPQRRAARRARSEAAEEARLQLRRVGIEELAGNFPDEISGGQRQRVAIARALCLGPEIMLFDEPTSALDPEMIAEVLAIMRELVRDGMTLVCVTHEMGFARQVADRVVFMDGGLVVEEGPPDAVFSAPRHEKTRAFMASLSAPG